MTDDNTNPQDDKVTEQQNNQQSDPLIDALNKAQQEAQQEQSQEENSSGAQLNDDLQKMTEVAQRAMADLANFRRRTEEEKAHLIGYANLDLMRELLPVLDNFHRSQNHLPQELNDEAQNWVNGITQTFKTFEDTLTKKGLTEIKSVGEKFDPHMHEAVLQGPGEKDMVTEEMEKGYTLGSRVVRTAKVKVGNGE